MFFFIFIFNFLPVFLYFGTVMLSILNSIVLLYIVSSSLPNCVRQVRISYFSSIAKPQTLKQNVVYKRTSLSEYYPRDTVIADIRYVLQLTRLPRDAEPS